MNDKKKYITGEPRVEFYDFMGHHFIFADRYNIRIYECTKCNMEAFIKIENDILEEISHTDRGWIELNISCDEMIIKNIIE